MRAIIIACMVLVASTQVHAQRYFASLMWSVATPAGAFRSFVNETSASGFGLDVQWWVADHISVGVVGGYNMWSDVFRDRTHEFQSGAYDAAINGTQVHTVNSFTIMAGSRYVFGRSRDVRPFVGVAAGAVTSNQVLDVGFVEFNEVNWHLGVAPSVGLLIPVSFQTMVDLSARMSYGFPSGTALYDASTHAIAFWSINAGITFGN
jgi:hypothetical protein